MKAIIAIFFLFFCISSAHGRLLDKAQKVDDFAHGVPIYGISLDGQQIYVIRDSTEYIEVYCAAGGNQPLFNLSISGLQGPYDMVGSGIRSVFIADWFDFGNITGTRLKPPYTEWKFSIDEPFTVVGLAALKRYSSVLVTCSATQKIKEFSKYGSLRKVISVPEIFQPRHTIKLRDGYAVCHGWGVDQLHRVCLLNAKGKIQVCHGGHNGTGDDQLDVPARILELPEEGILVADRENKRVVLLDSRTLKFKKEIVTAADGLDGPARLLYVHPVLYIADNTIENGLSVRGKILAFRIMS